jgi:hypothetical protein
MSVEKAFREMIRAEVELQLRPLQRTVERLAQGTAELDGLRVLASRLQPLAGLLAGDSEVGVRRRGRPPAGGTERRASPGRPAAVSRACAIIGCRRPSRTKGYCAAHYQKLRMLVRTNRRPAEWKDGAEPHTVPDLILPRGRAASKKRESGG